MWFFLLGILLGIAIYWAIAIILVKRVLDRHIDHIDSASLPTLWFSEVPEHNQE
jgi:hypothetical protein